MSALEAIDAWPGGAKAAAVLIGGDVVEDRGDVWAPLRWASVTKLATALATMVAVERGVLGLDEPAGPSGSTVRHLLAHASGLGFSDDRDEEAFRPGRRAAPGTRRIYSNAGYEVLGTVVADAVGQPIERWLRTAVLDPLGMSATALDGSAAAGMVGPLADLIGIAGELQRPTLVSAGTAQLMRSVAFPGLDGLLPGIGYQRPNDWGLGPEIRGAKRPHWTGGRNSAATFGHFGQAGGFVWVDPEAGVACACLTGTDFGPWARAAWPALSDAVLAEHRSA